MHRIIIVTDARHPQVNGVVRSIEQTVLHLGGLGVDVRLTKPSGFRHIPAPPIKKSAGACQPWLGGRGAGTVRTCTPAFLNLDLPGSKVVIGDGPALSALKALGKRRDAANR